MKQPALAVETSIVPALEAQISALKEVSSLLKEQLEDTRKDRVVDARPRRHGLFGWRKD